MKIYLAGYMPKTDEEWKNYYNWRDDYKDVLEEFCDAEFVDPFLKENLENWNVDLTDSMSTFGRDCYNIKDSDFIIINADKILWPWTSQEIVIAKYFKKPVVTILPYWEYRRKNVNIDWNLVKDWIHPFVEMLSDFILEDIKEFDKNILNKIKKQKYKNITIIDDSIKYYLSNL